MSNNNEITDTTLFIRSSHDEMVTWDKSKIVEALIREADIPKEKAELIADSVEESIEHINMSKITTSLIRELVDIELIREGLEDARNKHTRIGIPLYDVERMISYPSKENANVPHGPEATNLNIAEIIKKEFALAKVFSPNVAEAHVRGDIHLHDLGFIDRPYCSGNNLAYVEKFGLNLVGAMSIAQPAHHPEVLLAHMIKFSAALQGCFAGAIGWDAVNIFFAPYIGDKTDHEVKHLAQMLIFEFSQQAVARGGQAIFSDLNFYWEIPNHFKDVQAMGPGGELTGKTYGEYEKDAQRFATAVFEVYLHGDGTGRPFFFPKPIVHITEAFFRTPGHEEFLELLCKVSIEKGNTYFVFDRGETAKISECCRLSFKLKAQDLEDAKTPWKLRFCALQNVTINLPRIGYECGNDKDKVYALLKDRFELVVQAHMQKKAFIETLLSLGTIGPLGLLCMSRDGERYLRMHKVTYLVGMIGLNEMVKAVTNFEMHENPNAFLFGLDVINHLRILAEEAKKTTGMNFVLEQTPAESTAYRLAKLDLKHYGKKAAEAVQGSIEDNEVYYTNSTYLAAKSGIHFTERVTKEGMFHPLIEAGALSHLWLGEKRPFVSSLANLIKKIFRNTKNDQVAISPEFTICNECDHLERGLLTLCTKCGSDNVDGITRITGYFSRISSWNKGKKGELRDRHRESI